MRWLALAVLVGCAATAPAPAPRAPAVDESGRVVRLRVIDGDTVRAVLRIEAPALDVAVEGERLVRLAGIDTPELRGRCPEERELAQRARDRLVAFVREAADLRLALAGSDKYGRALGHLAADGYDAAATLIAAGLARPYEGGRRAGWCGDDE